MSPNLVSKKWSNLFKHSTVGKSRKVRVVQYASCVETNKRELPSHFTDFQATSKFAVVGLVRSIVVVVVVSVVVVVVVIVVVDVDAVTVGNNSDFTGKLEELKFGLTDPWKLVFGL